jgi:hypothetical protein
MELGGDEGQFSFVEQELRQQNSGLGIGVGIGFEVGHGVSQTSVD